MNKIAFLSLLTAILLTGCDVVTDEHKETAEIVIGNVAGDLVDAAKETTGKVINKAADAALNLIDKDSILNHCEATHE